MTAAVGVARAAAGGTAARSAGGSATRSAGRGGTGDVVADVAAGRLPGGSKPKARKKTRVRGSQRVLLAEFMVCVLLLGLHPISRPEGEVSGKEWMKRGTAVCFLFVILGMAGSIGPRAQRASAMFGGIIAVMLLIDQRSAFGVLVKKLNEPPAPPPSEGPASASSGGFTGGGGG